MSCNFILFEKMSWYSTPAGKYQPLEFTEHVTRNFDFRKTEFLHFIYTPGILVQLLFLFVTDKL